MSLVLVAWVFDVFDVDVETVFVTDRRDRLGDLDDADRARGLVVDGVGGGALGVIDEREPREPSTASSRLTNGFRCSPLPYTVSG